MKYKIGDKVRIIHKDAAAHRLAGGLPTVGHIDKIDDDHYLGHHRRPYRLKFPDFHSSWWSSNEIRKVR